VRSRVLTGARRGCAGRRATGGKGNWAPRGDDGDMEPIEGGGVWRGRRLLQRGQARDWNSSWFCRRRPLFPAPARYLLPRYGTNERKDAVFVWEWARWRVGYGCMGSFRLGSAIVHLICYSVREFFELHDNNYCVVMHLREN
jgi:hypothetical protein